jgi:hypothetical protein
VEKYWLGLISICGGVVKCGHLANFSFPMTLKHLNAPEAGISDFTIGKFPPPTWLLMQYHIEYIG